MTDPAAQDLDGSERTTRAADASVPTGDDGPTSTGSLDEPGADGDPDAPPVPLPPGASFGPMRMPSKAFLVAALGVALAVGVVIVAGQALFVFAIGVALSFFLVPVVDRLEAHGVPRIAAAILVVAICVVVTLVVLIGGTLILLEQGVAFLRAVPSYIATLRADYEAMDLPTYVTDPVDQLVATVHDVLASANWVVVGLGVVQGFLGIIGTLFAFMLLPFFTFYLLKDQPRMHRNFYRQVPEPWKPDVSFMANTFTADFAQYFKAELLVGSIMGVSVAIGMTLIGMVVGGPLGSFALLLGLIAFVMELLPQIGPIISYVPALLIALTISPLAVALVSVFYFIAFNIEGSVLVPTFEGRMISFSGATVLVLITIGFALGGIIGAIVALPVAAIIRDLFAHFFQKAQRESIVLPGSTAPAG
ncbi:MAG: AI-2E family transporter [Chloroflexi bacterium]|nr:AI-2E family transporter [Chloroflexota bacterium]